MTQDNDAASPSVVNARGNRIHVMPGDSRGDALVAAAGDFNPHSMQLWQAILGLRSWDVVVDVGANYGEMLLGIEPPPGARLIAFEPNPGVRDCLERSCREAGLDVQIRPCAVGARVAQTVPFVLDNNWSGVSGMSTTHRSALSSELTTMEVPVSTLTAELEGLPKEAAVCIKVDVEGAELDVLDGAAGLLDDRESWALMIETLHMSDFEIHDLAHAYRLGMLDKGTGRIIGMPRVTEEPLRNLLNASWMYRQDVVLMSESVARERIGSIGD